MLVWYLKSFLKTLSIISFLLGAYLVLRPANQNVYWVFHLHELIEKDDDYHILHGLRIGAGSFLLTLGFILWNETYWLFPWALSISALIGLSSGNNLRIQQKAAKKLSPKEKTKNNE